MIHTNEIKEFGRIAWTGWTAGIIGAGIYTLSNGQLPAFDSSITYLTAGFAILAAVAAVFVAIENRRRRFT